MIPKFLGHTGSTRDKANLKVKWEKTRFKENEKEAMLKMRKRHV
jgi:hypothetical protein